MAIQSSSDFVFSTKSAIWEVNSQWTGLIYGPAAAILQIAHPKVAHGVARHSNFKSDALGRLTRTLTDVNSVAFGTWAEAEETKKRLLEMHSKVRGTSESGLDYHALDQDLLVWVLATLVMASVKGRELVYGPIDLDQKEEFLGEMVTLGLFFGIREGSDDRLSSWKNYEDYYDEMINSDFLGSDPVCGELARCLVKPQDRLTVTLLGLITSFLPVETLPSQLLKPLTLKTTIVSRAKMRWFKWAFPIIFRWLPEKLKYFERTRRRHFDNE